MELLWFIKDGNTGLPVTNADEYTSVGIRRAADGYIYNWSTNSFSVSGSASLETYTEVALLPGLYVKNIDVSGWNNGLYQVISYLETPELATTRAYELTVSNGSAYESPSEIALTTSTPAATLLVQEYYNNQDLDNNGLIYGVDFYISTGRPRILDQIPRRGVPLSWEDYLTSI